jgi:hypothetical protein
MDDVPGVQLSAAVLVREQIRFGVLNISFHPEALSPNKRLGSDDNYNLCKELEDLRRIKADVLPNVCA